MIKRITIIIISIMLLGGCRCWKPTAEHLTGVIIPNADAIELPLFYDLPTVVRRYAPPGLNYTYGRFQPKDIMRFLHHGKRVVAVVPFTGEYRHGVVVTKMTDVNWATVYEFHIASN